MNTQEREQLGQFLQQLTQAPAAQKDSEADRLIREACAQQPDAAYLLVQRAMLLDQAWQNAQRQVARLQEESEQLRTQLHSPAHAGNGSGGFLDPNAWGNSAALRVNPAPQAVPCPTAPALAAPAPSAWGSGMLGNIATTAAGVVAGGFLFQGIEHLLGNHANHDPHAQNPGAMNGLSNDLPAAPPASSSGVFDTSSVDDFIAGNSDDSA